MIHDPFGRSRLPDGFTREDRVRLLGEVARDLLAGRTPPLPARLFVGGAINAWLANGGGLEHDYLKVNARRGSHRTPATIWACHRDEGERFEDGGNSTCPQQNEESR